MTHTYQITGMTCNNCIAKVKSELLKLGDVQAVEMQLDPPQATITMSRHINDKELQAAVTKAGNYSISALDDMHTSAEKTEAENEVRGKSYFPVFLIFGYIGLVATLIQVVRGSFSWMQWMTHFMAGFFLVFSFFKFLDLKGFADGYRNYDLVAKRFPAWGFIYPFIELGLGIAFLVFGHADEVVITSLVIMIIAAAGVAESLVTKKRFQCACLGTTIALPLGMVALIEDLLMVAMSIVVLFLMH